MKADPKGVLTGAHFIDGACISRLRAAVLHFKYLHNFSSHVMNEVTRNEHYFGAIEYKGYAAKMQTNPNLGAMHKEACEFKNSSTLVDAGIMICPKNFKLLLGDHNTSFCT